MVRVYSKQHIGEGIEWIKDPLHLSSSKLEELASRRHQVVFDTVGLKPDQLSRVYQLGEKTGIPVVQREYTIKGCTFTGIFNYNDCQYIGDAEGFQQVLTELFNSIIDSSQDVIDQKSLL